MKALRGNISALLVGQLSKLALQAVYFVVIARMLGADGYGAFAAGLALAALAAPFCSLGVNTLMIKNIARDDSDAALQWWRALAYTVVGGALFAAFLSLLTPWIAPAGLSPLVILQLAVADLVGLRMVDLVGAVWQALGRTRPLAILPSVTNLVRLIASLAIWLSHGEVTLDVWAPVYMAATLPLGLIVCVRTTMDLGRSKRRLRTRFREIREGLLYSLALSAQNIYNDIDKAMLARIVSSSASGVYSAAYRVVDMAYAPIRSVAAATYPLYFQHGQEGLRATLKLTRRIMPMVLGYGLFGALALVIAAPLAPLILGEDYVEAVGLIRLMAVLIVLRAFSFLAADALTGCGRQSFRTFAQVSVALINVVANLYLLPRFGVLGAVISTLLCEFVLAAALWTYIAFYLRREPRSPDGRAPASSVGSSRA